MKLCFYEYSEKIVAIPRNVLKCRVGQRTATGPRTPRPETHKSILRNENIDLCSKLSICVEKNVGEVILRGDALTLNASNSNQGTVA